MTTNEPAFPSTNQGPTTAPEIYYGMTLRDYFAAKAMPVDYELAKKSKKYSDTDWRIGIALDAYKMADAMLKARSME